MICSIENLPAEISLLILEDHISNPNDLYALIRASPVQYNVFWQRQIPILAAVLRRAIHPCLMKLAIRTVLAKSVSFRALMVEVEDLLQWNIDRGHDFRFDFNKIEDDEILDEEEDGEKGRALARLMKSYRITYDQLELSSLAKENRKISKARCGARIRRVKDKLLRSLKQKRCIQFIQEPLDDDRELAYLRDRMVLRQLCQLWRIVDHFILNYVQAARVQQKLIQATNPWAYSGTDWECVEIPKKLSEIEHGRIQRAFIYVEMYRRMHSTWGLETPLADVLYRRSYYWKRFISQMTHFEYVEFFTVYQYLFNYTADILEKIELHAEEQIKSAASKGCDYAKNDYISPSSGHFSSLPLFQSKNETDLVLSFAAKLGLPFLKRFSEIGIMQKMTLLNRITEEIEGKRCVERSRRGRFSSSWGRLSKHPLNSPSCGFTLLDDKAKASLSEVEYFPVREQGYIFWDNVKEVRNLKEIKYPLSSQRRHRDQNWSLEKHLHRHGCAIGQETLEASLPLVMTESEIATFIDSCDY